MTRRGPRVTSIARPADALRASSSVVRSDSPSSAIICSGDVVGFDVIARASSGGSAAIAARTSAGTRGCACCGAAISALVLVGVDVGCACDCADTAARACSIASARADSCSFFVAVRSATRWAICASTRWRSATWAAARSAAATLACCVAR